MALGTCGVPAFQFGVDRAVAPATTIQLGFVRHAAAVMVAEKLSAKLNTCERDMKPAVRPEGQLRRIVKLSGINISETVRRFPDCA